MFSIVNSGYEDVKRQELNSTEGLPAVGFERFTRHSCEHLNTLNRACHGSLRLRSRSCGEVLACKS